MLLGKVLSEALNFIHKKFNYFFFACLIYSIIYLLFNLLPGKNLLFNYTTRYESSYLSIDYINTFCFLILDVLFTSLCAIWIHNNFIFGKFNFNKNFTKIILRYSLFLFLLSLCTERTFFSGLLLHFAQGALYENLFLGSVFVVYIILVFPLIIIVFLSFLWILYMPNLALNDGVSFFKFFKLSKGYRFLIIKLILFQLILFITLVFLGILFLSRSIAFQEFILLIFDMFIILYLITCLSVIYKNFRKEVLNLD